MVRYVKGQSPPIEDLEGDANVESDCDGELPETGAELSSTEGTEEETCAVLITGSFAAYVHAVITFVSRGVTSFTVGNLFFSAVAQM